MPATLTEGSAWVGACGVHVARHRPDLKGGANQALSGSARLGISNVKPHSGSV
jgi:hypothetical protein